jgi:hypothetical protein
MQIQSTWNEVIIWIFQRWEVAKSVQVKTRTIEQIWAVLRAICVPEVHDSNLRWTLVMRQRVCAVSYFFHTNSRIATRNRLRPLHHSVWIYRKSHLTQNKPGSLIVFLTAFSRFSWRCSMHGITFHNSSAGSCVYAWKLAHKNFILRSSLIYKLLEMTTPFENSATFMDTVNKPLYL